jgi:hypothetical protein
LVDKDGAVIRVTAGPWWRGGKAEAVGVLLGVDRVDNSRGDRPPRRLSAYLE